MLVNDPNLQWASVPGVHHYRLSVSTSPSFAGSYDTISTDYTAYTPYAAGARNVYLNGVVLLESSRARQRQQCHRHQ